MKNVVDIDTKVICGCCRESGFFSFESTTMTCPRCDMTVDSDHDVECGNDFYSFCKYCGIVFDPFGCSHNDNEFLHNAHLIKEYEYKGHTYIGMPLFESVEEWKNEWENVKVLQWYCPNAVCQNNAL